MTDDFDTTKKRVSWTAVGTGFGKLDELMRWGANAPVYCPKCSKMFSPDDWPAHASEGFYRCLS